MGKSPQDLLNKKKRPQRGTYGNSLKIGYEQKRRLSDRQHGPLKQWKASPIDEVAVKHRDD